MADFKGKWSVEKTEIVVGDGSYAPAVGSEIHIEGLLGGYVFLFTPHKGGLAPQSFSIPKRHPDKLERFPPSSERGYLLQAELGPPGSSPTTLVGRIGFGLGPEDPGNEDNDTATFTATKTSN